MKGRISKAIILAFFLAFSANFIFAAKKIDINTASFEELQEIKWVGPSVAQQIIKARPFYSLDELKTKIKFISEKRLADIKEQGIAWIDPNLKPPKIEKTESIEKGLAAAAEPFRQEPLDKKVSNSFSIFLIALAIAIFSGIIVLILKRKLKNFDLSKK